MVAEKASRLADLRAFSSLRPSNQDKRPPPKHSLFAMISGTVGRVLVPESPSFGTRPVEFGYAGCRIRVRRSAFRVHFGGTGDPFSGDQVATNSLCAGLARWPRIDACHARPSQDTPLWGCLTAWSSPL